MAIRTVTSVREKWSYWVDSPCRRGRAEGCTVVAINEREEEGVDRPLCSRCRAEFSEEELGLWGELESAFAPLRGHPPQLTPGDVTEEGSGEPRFKSTWFPLGDGMDKRRTWHMRASFWS